MLKQDIIVIGASAGGVPALQRLVSGLPPELPAAVFIVLHLSARSESLLPAILERAGPLPAAHPGDRAEIAHGRIYVAPPDYHLVLEHGHVHLHHGPKENFHRPAINPLFRSAALNYGNRVAGVLLTGLRDDGVPGLWEIKRRGGITIIQDPDEAPFPDLPRNAAESVSIDYPVSIADMPSLLERLATEGCDSEDFNQEMDMDPQPTQLSCPECQGTLSVREAGKVSEFSCIIGHRYSGHTLHEALSNTDENALWAAVRALEQSAMFATQFARELWPHMEQEAKYKREQASAIRKLLEAVYHGRHSG